MEQPPSESTVYQSLRGMKQVSLVEQPQGSLHEITDRGRAYLSGELNAGDLEEGNEVRGSC
jgi:DNA-binding PadR family transcriptional regulator